MASRGACMSVGSRDGTLGRIRPDGVLPILYGTKPIYRPFLRSKNSAGYDGYEPKDCGLSLQSCNFVGHFRHTRLFGAQGLIFIKSQEQDLDTVH